jgi:predicted nucleic acid-binding protein
MTLLVDTSVWSLALRRDTPPDTPEAVALRSALTGTEIVVTTGLILQELVQGVVPKRSRTKIVERFSTVPMVHPDRDDHTSAADLRNHCRRSGVQLGTVDALIAQLCIRHGLALLSTDRDFVNAARHTDLRLWNSPDAS